MRTIESLPCESTFVLRTSPLKAASGNANLDNYTRAHFNENVARISKALDARYVIVK
jgi:hypothetical protein